MTVGRGEGVPTTIKQIIELVPIAQKKSRLDYFLNLHNTPTIVFVNSRLECDAVALLLGPSRCIQVHGGKTQQQREEALRQFRDKKKRIMIATDVMGRGVDIKGCGCVINWEMAKNVEGK